MLGLEEGEGVSAGEVLHCFGLPSSFREGNSGATLTSSVLLWTCGGVQLNYSHLSSLSHIIKEQNYVDFSNTGPSHRS